MQLIVIQALWNVGGLAASHNVIMTIKMESLNNPKRIELPLNVLKAAKIAMRLYNKTQSWI